MSTLNKLLKHAFRVDATHTTGGDIIFTLDQLESFMGNIQDDILADMKTWMDADADADQYNQGIADGMASVIWLGDYNDEP
jgi:hypothetical protein